MNCSSCRKPLAPGLVYFCRLCFFALPGGERVALVRMHGRKQDCASKIARCVRILAEKRAVKLTVVADVKPGEPTISIPCNES